MNPEYLYPGVYVEEISHLSRRMTGTGGAERASSVLSAKHAATLRAIAKRLRQGGPATVWLAGASGSTKTLAAQMLAGELGLDVYRVDLSRVTAKYIGETEKNLDRIFDKAGESGAILFFDEADALFGRRSEVKDSHDRYANIEIRYLLKRLESFEGLVILATNRKQPPDAAFLRKFKYVIPLFNAPAPGKNKSKARKGKRD